MDLLPDFFLMFLAVTGMYTILSWIINQLFDYTLSGFSAILLFVASAMIVYRICKATGDDDEPE